MNSSSISFDSGTRIFTLLEDDDNNIASYTVTTKALNHNSVDTGANFSFTVNFTGSCNRPLTVTASSYPDIEYKIGSDQYFSDPFEGFTVIPEYCELEYRFTVDPELINPSSINLDSESRIFELNEDDV